MCERSNSPNFLLCQCQLLRDLCSVDHAVACENRTVDRAECA
jgi:hypothetical protein